MTLQDLLNLLLDPRVGIIGFLLAGLWWLNELRKEERADRIELQKERDALLERMINAMNTGTVAITSIKDLLQSGVRRE